MSATDIIMLSLENNTNNNNNNNNNSQQQKQEIIEQQERSSETHSFCGSPEKEENDEEEEEELGEGEEETTSTASATTSKSGGSLIGCTGISKNSRNNSNSNITTTTSNSCNSDSESSDNTNNDNNSTGSATATITFNQRGELTKSGPAKRFSVDTIMTELDSDMNFSKELRCVDDEAVENIVDINVEVVDADNGNDCDAGAATASVGSSSHHGFLEHMEGCIYYFGYGPIVNQLVRERRGLGHIPSENIQAAILYDHRLRFVEGGTANIIPSTGWDVKGVLIKFENPVEFHQLHHFDANYDIKDVSVSMIDKTNLDPRQKNDHTAPFALQQQNEKEQEEKRPVPPDRVGSCPVLHDSEVVEDGDDDDDGGDGDSFDDQDYSCPFDMSSAMKEQRSRMMLGLERSDEVENPNAVHAVTFVIAPKSNSDRFASGGGPNTAMSTSSTGSYSDRSTDSEKKAAISVGMPQERYLKLITEGLRQNDIDETYINDEILSVSYIPNELDVPKSSTTEKTNYRSFPMAPGMKKVPKIGYDKYVKKASGIASSSSLASLKGRNGNRKTRSSITSTGGGDGHGGDDQLIYFICGKKIMRLEQDDSEPTNNACTRWVKEMCHGHMDCTFVVHQTFVDPESDLPPVTCEADITPDHQLWAEHTLLLYLERGGLSAVHLYDLDETRDGLGGDSFSSKDGNQRKRNSFLGSSIHGKSMPSIGHLKASLAKASHSGGRTSYTSTCSAASGDELSNSFHRKQKSERGGKSKSVVTKVAGKFHRSNSVESCGHNDLNSSIVDPSRISQTSTGDVSMSSTRSTSSVKQKLKHTFKNFKRSSKGHDKHHD